MIHHIEMKLLLKIESKVDRRKEVAGAFRPSTLAFNLNDFNVTLNAEFSSQNLTDEKLTLT